MYRDISDVFCYDYYVLYNVYLCENKSKHYSHHTMLFGMVFCYYVQF